MRLDTPEIRRVEALYLVAKNSYSEYESYDVETRDAQHKDVLMCQLLVRHPHTYLILQSLVAGVLDAGRGRCPR